MDNQKKTYQVLARKYRPQKLAELIGQDALVTTLRNAIMMDRLPHAFVLTGIRGVGKTSTARIIARSLLCVGADGKGEKPTVDPCGVCEQCRAIAEDRHVDVLEMDAASRTGVGDIREILDSIHYMPVLGRSKIYIIDEVHMLSKNAFNALLKTLEEPPAHVKFVFATTEVRKIPVTILSRCMRFDLPRVEAGIMVPHLQHVATAEKADIEENALQVIAYASEGSVRDGLSLLDRVVAFHAGKAGAITAEDVRGLLGYTDKSQGLALLEAIVESQPDRALSVLKTLYQAGADPVMVLQDLLELVHAITKVKVTQDTAYLVEQEQDKIRAFSSDLSFAFLTRAWQMLLKGISEAYTASSTLHATEMVLIRLCYASTMPTPGDLLKNPEAFTSTTSGKSEAVEKQAPAALVTAKAEEVPATANKDAAAVALKTFADLLALCDKKGESFIRSWLEQISLITFDAAQRRMEFRPVDAAPKDLANKVSRYLQEWTGERWVVIISNSAGQKSIREQKDEQWAEARKIAELDPLVVAALKHFPGAEIRDMKPLGTPKILTKILPETSSTSDQSEPIINQREEQRG